MYENAKVDAFGKASKPQIGRTGWSVWWLAFFFFGMLVPETKYLGCRCELKRK